MKEKTNRVSIYKEVYDAQRYMMEKELEYNRKKNLLINIFVFAFLIFGVAVILLLAN